MVGFVIISFSSSVVYTIVDIVKVFLKELGIFEGKYGFSF